jgi:flagellar basal body P-ring formation protein FlgA
VTSNVSRIEAGLNRTQRLLRARICALMSVAAAVAVLLFAAPAHAREFTMPVPRVTIYPGDVIAEGMIVEKAFRNPDFSGPAFIAHRESLVGKVARQTLLPNQPVAVMGLREPHAIKQGQPAVVIFQSGGLVISSTAMPLQSGAVGEVISLRNVESGTTIRGVVHTDGTVRVGGP